MRDRFFSAARAVLLVVLVACAHGKRPTTVSGASSPDEVVAVTRVMEQWRQAYEVKSFEALEKLYAPDSQVALVNNGVVHLGWDAVSASIKERLSKGKQIRVRFKEVRVISVAPTATIAITTMTREMTDGVTSVSETGTLTVTLRGLSDGDSSCAEACPLRWVIVAEHFSNRLPS